MKLESAGELIGLLHDLGKYSAEFQECIGSALGLIDTDEDEYVDAGILKGKVDHSTAGAQYVWQALSVRGAKERIAGQILALCIASHHSGLIDCISSASASFGEDTFTKRLRRSGERTRAHVRGPAQRRRRRSSSDRLRA
jgi:CRISPR-associated endonuclease/helicase Cas3